MSTQNYGVAIEVALISCLLNNSNGVLKAESRNLSTVFSPAVFAPPFSLQAVFSPAVFAPAVFAPAKIYF